MAKIYSGNNMQYRLAIESIGTLISFTIFLSVYLLLYHQLLKRQEAERMQQKLAQEKELSELKLEFLALVSHEFRTPLSVILGSAQLLKDSLSSQIERSRLRSLTRIESSAKAMKQMFADVLTIARAPRREYRRRGQNPPVEYIADYQCDRQGTRPANPPRKSPPHWKKAD